MKNLKKFSQKDRYGNMISFEFEVPPMENQVPKFEDYFNHPGQPQGTDTVPAWLTPGERVMNAEAERIYGPVLAQMNDEGRAIQAAQGGTIPNYGPEPEYAAGGCKVKYAAKGSKASCDCPECSRTVYAADGEWITRNLLDQLRQVESGGDPNAVSSMGAIGPYQLMPATIADPGYGVQVPENFDPTNEAQSRAFAESYLKGIQAQYPDYTPQEVLAAYNAGPGRVAQYKAGEIPQLPQETQDYIGKFDIAMSAPDAPIVDAQGNVYPIDTLSASTAPPSPIKKEQSWWEWLTTPQEQTLSKTIDDSLGIDLGNDGIPKDEGRSELPPPKPTPAMQAIIDDKKGIPHPLEGKSFIERIMTPRDEYITVTSPEEKAAAGMGGPEESDLQTIEPAIEASEGAEMPSFTTKEKALAKVRELDARTLDDDIGMQYDETSDEERALYDQAKTWINQQTGDFNLGNVLESVASSITGFMGDSGLLDSNELSRAAIMYLGSRAFGYDHGGSAQWAAQNYLKRIDAKDKQKEAYAKAALGTYTTKSIEKFRKSGKLSDLKPINTTEFSKDFKVFEINIDGKKQRVNGYWDKTSQQYYYRTPNGNAIIPPNAKEWTEDKSGQSYAAWKGRSISPANDIINDAYRDNKGNVKRPKGFPNGSQIAGQSLSYFDKIFGVQVENIRVQNEMDNIMFNAIPAMIEYQKNNPNKEVTSILPFLNQERLKGIVASDYTRVFAINPDAPLDEMEFLAPELQSEITDNLSAVIKADPRFADANTVQLEQQNRAFMTQAADVWVSLSEEQQKSYGSPSTKDKENGFYLFMNKLLKDNKISSEEIKAESPANN